MHPPRMQCPTPATEGNQDLEMHALLAHALRKTTRIAAIAQDSLATGFVVPATAHGRGTTPPNAHPHTPATHIAAVVRGGPTNNNNT